MSKKEGMTLNEYQRKAMLTCMETSNNFSYMTCNLIGELGEFFGKVGKHLRKEQVAIIDNKLDCENISVEDENELKKEAGDIMWQLFGLIDTLGWSAEEIAQMNLDKLQKRKSDGVIDGNGDNR